MNYKKTDIRKVIMKKAGLMIWNMAEYLSIDLGKFAPIVFGWMIGKRGKRIK